MTIQQHGKEPLLAYNVCAAPRLPPAEQGIHCGINPGTSACLAPSCNACSGASHALRGGARARLFRVGPSRQLGPKETAVQVVCHTRCYTLHQVSPTHKFKALPCGFLLAATVWNCRPRLSSSGLA